MFKSRNISPALLVPGLLRVRHGVSAPRVDHGLALRVARFLAPLNRCCIYAAAATPIIFCSSATIIVSASLSEQQRIDSILHFVSSCSLFSLSCSDSTTCSFAPAAMSSLASYQSKSIPAMACAAVVARLASHRHAAHTCGHFYNLQRPRSLRVYQEQHDRSCRRALHPQRTCSICNCAQQL